MTPQDNMLEIFRQAGKSPSAAAGSAGGPFVGGNGSDLPAPEPAGQPRGLVFVFALLIAFVLGIATGRQLFAPKAASAGSGGEASTQRGDSPRDWLGETGIEDSQEADRGTVSPLYDAALRYTVVVATYANTTIQQEYAWNTHDHLAAAGLEVFPPLSTGGKVVVLAGASRSSDDLKGLQARICSLDGWDGRTGAYKTAYIEQIDKLIDR
jgi:hypothetical protein